MTAASRSHSNFQTGALVALRLVVGWHFLYEGLAKLGNPYWTSAGYLADAHGWFKGLFLWIAASSTAVTIVDYLNIWGLMLIGLGLLLGLLTRPATITAIVLLALYYLAAPPLVGYEYAMPTEGSYLIVNKILVELAALVVLLAYPTGASWGVDRFLHRAREPKQPLTHARVEGEVV